MAEHPDELVITLRKPVKLGDMTYERLELREPTAGEMLEWDDKSGAEADIIAVSLVAGVPRKAIEKIGARDMLTAARFIGRFLSSAPTTGASV